MTDVVKLAIPGRGVFNGSVVATVNKLGSFNYIHPTINDNTPVSGVNSVTTNGYLDTRFTSNDNT